MTPIPPHDRLVLATHNEGKLREFEALLTPLLTQFGWRLVSAGALGLASPVENGVTFRDNALLKAEAGYTATGLPTLADDSGLEVDALDGAPGVLSARWAQTANGLDFAAAMDRICTSLKGVTSRSARFVCALALCIPATNARPAKRYVVQGTLEGTIAEAPHHGGGFGYDPIFIPQNHTQTLAQLTAEQKNQLSHRGCAVRALYTALHEA